MVDTATAMQITMEELKAEQEEITSNFRALRFAQKIRGTAMNCYKACGGEVKYTAGGYYLNQDNLIGKSNHCFGDCLNANFEQGPFLKDLGTVPEDSIPKKFIWSHGL